MARSIERLLKTTFHRLPPGLHADGGNLYLQVSLGADQKTRRSSWVFRYKMSGCRTRDMGLGSTNDLNLAEAREVARKYRNLVRERLDPIEYRDRERAKNLASAKQVKTFDEAADEYIRLHRATWRNPSHAQQWPTSLKTYASPIIGKLLVSDIDTHHILEVLEPIWATKTETATRVRQRIEVILDWAKVSKLRDGENPARWRDHLKKKLPAPRKIRTVQPQPALKYKEMPDFIKKLRGRDGVAPLALQFLIFTGVRTADVRNAKLADIDIEKRVWTIPHFTKTNKEHQVPLSTAAIDAFKKARSHFEGTSLGGEYAFPNDVSDQPLSENALSALVHRMGFKGRATPHGFRSSFRTWMQNETSFSRELAEMSLGHTVGSESERAYARGDTLKKRAPIMQAWANFCCSERTAGTVTPIGHRARASINEARS